jgi:hypothetical protein
MVEATPMIDLCYVLGTLGFFAAMLAYLRGLEALGRRADGESE